MSIAIASDFHVDGAKSPQNLAERKGPLIPLSLLFWEKKKRKSLVNSEDFLSAPNLHNPWKRKEKLSQKARKMQNEEKQGNQKNKGRGIRRAKSPEISQKEGVNLGLGIRSSKSQRAGDSAPLLCLVSENAIAISGVRDGHRNRKSQNLLRSRRAKRSTHFRDAAHQEDVIVQA